MSKFTTQVRYICEVAAGKEHSVGYDEIDSVITTAAPLIIPQYPIFDEQYRLVLNKKILMHYYTREICEETVGLWKLRLSARLNEIMPYYNQLYESATLEFNPLYDIDVMTKHGGNKNQIGSTQRRSESKTDGNVTKTDFTNENQDNTNMYSDTPQGGLNNFDPSSTHLTNATKDEKKINRTNANNNTYGQNNNTNNTEDNVISNTEEYIERISGKRSGVSYSNLLLDYRKTMINIDEMIIKDLSDLFFSLYE